jgi:ABC-type glycerol-3-phosphate transport system permease component
MFKTMATSKSTKRILIYTAVCIFLFVCVFPFVWVLTGSFHSLSQIMRGQVQWIPREPTVENYIPLFFSKMGIKNFPIYILNSLIIGGATAVLSSIVAALGGYGLSRYDFYGKDALSRMMLFIYVFPVVLLALPINDTMAWMRLVDSRLGIILIHTALAAPFCTWLLRSFFDSIPKEVEESAAVDGANKIQALMRIVLPLAAPGVLVAAVYSLVSSWGEYMFASILISSDALKTLPLGIAMYTSEQYIEWGQMLGGTVLTFVPLLLIFMPLSKRFLQGFIEGAIK